MNGHVARQAPLPSGKIDVGLLFAELTPLARRKLTEMMFGNPAPWEEGDRCHPGIAGSLRSLLHTLAVPWRKYQWNQQHMVRLRTPPCRLRASNRLLTGHLTDMSFTGVSAVFCRTPTGSLAGSLLELPQVTLKVSPVAIVRRWRTTLVRFRVDSVECGEPRWRD